LGTTLAFHCERCGYQAQVSGGGDAGLSAITQTVSCRRCRQLSDILVEWVEGMPRPSHEPFPPRQDRLGCCRHCGSRAVDPWTSGGPCPRCGGRMHEGDEVCLWD
jgi:hypothetical protein